MKIILFTYYVRQLVNILSTIEHLVKEISLFKEVKKKIVRWCWKSRLPSDWGFDGTPVIITVPQDWNFLENSDHDFYCMTASNWGHQVYIYLVINLLILKYIKLTWSNFPPVKYFNIQNAVLHQDTKWFILGCSPTGIHFHVPGIVQIRFW